MTTSQAEPPEPEQSEPPDPGTLAADTGSPLAVRQGDFYLQGGNMVFTAAYHLRRGYCCGSGCRHCPYQEWKR